MNSSLQDIWAALVARLGQRYAEQRLRLEEDHQAQIFGQGINFFHIENLFLSESVIRSALRLTGLYRRGFDNATRVELRHNLVNMARLPSAFDGLTILHISDMHVDMNAGALRALLELVEPPEYDICV